MFTRCPRSNLKPPLGQFYKLRHKSTTPTHVSKRSPRLHPWQQSFLTGTVLGIICSQGWLYWIAQEKDNSFTSYTLVAKQPVSSSASIFHLEPRSPSTRTSTHLEGYQEAWSKGIWNVQFKQPQIQIVRAYTPLPTQSSTLSFGDSGQKDSDSGLCFLIRKDPYGEVSSYLHNLPLGSEIEMRGPNIEYELSKDTRHVVFFAGGTGIATALQVAGWMFGNETGNQAKDDNKKSLHILWASRRREECIGGTSDESESRSTIGSVWAGLFSTKITQAVASREPGVIVRELEQLKQKYPGQIKVDYFVDEEDTWINQAVVSKALSQLQKQDSPRGHVVPEEQKQVLISGPPGFIAVIAGPKEWRNGHEEQGEVSRLVARAMIKSKQDIKVWKV